MKYLLTTRSRIGASVPKPGDPQTLFQATQAWTRARLEDGTFDCVYGLADGRGGVTIANAASHEDLLRLVRSSPMYYYMDYRIEPLCDVQLMWDQQIAAAGRSGA